MRFLSGAISQKRTEIVDFTDFYETECSEQNQRSPERRPVSPLVVAEAEDEANGATEMNGKTSHENQETSTILALFCEITLHLKNLNVTDLG